MGTDNLLKETQESFQKTFDWFKKEISAVRGGRVTIDLIDDLLLDYYDQKISLKEIASLSLFGPQTISIEPWDKSVIPNIEKAIRMSGLGGNVQNDGKRILFSLPTQTSEDKEKMIKLLKQKMEKAKVSLRQTRDEIWKKIQEMEREGEISEDEKFKQKDNLQKLIDEFEEKIEEIEKNKEKEILS